MICRIEVEGCDRCGKDTLVGYLDYLSNRQIPVGSRGLLSTLVYNDIYNRFMSTERQKEMIEGNKETLIVVLSANIEDIRIRCKMSHEQEIDIMRDLSKFYEYGNKLQELGLKVLFYNTTEKTPYRIANDILDKIQNHEEEL